MAVVLSLEEHKHKLGFPMSRPEERTDMRLAWNQYTLDDLEDLMWTEDGRVQTRMYSAHLDFITENFGHYSETRIVPFKPTEVRYRSIQNAQGQPLEGTFGKHPEFYSGWLKSYERKEIASSRFDFTRHGCRREARFWTQGYIEGAVYILSSLENEEMYKRRAPYQMGLVQAYKDIIGHQVKELKEPEEEASLMDVLYHKGYVELLKVAKILWPEGADSIQYD